MKPDVLSQIPSLRVEEGIIEEADMAVFVKTADGQKVCSIALDGYDSTSAEQVAACISRIPLMLALIQELRDLGGGYDERNRPFGRRAPVAYVLSNANALLKDLEPISSLLKPPSM